jgi:hypothetical protein
VGLKDRERLTGFVMSLPSRRVATMVEFHYLKDVDRDWNINDLRDILALSTAIPYCDIVVTDKRPGTSRKSVRILTKHSTPKSWGPWTNWLAIWAYSPRASLVLATHARRPVEQTAPIASADPYVTAPHSQRPVRCRPREQAIVPTSSRPGRSRWPRAQRCGGRTIHCPLVERIYMTGGRAAAARCRGKIAPGLCTFARTGIPLGLQP